MQRNAARPGTASKTHLAAQNSSRSDEVTKSRSDGVRRFRTASLRHCVTASLLLLAGGTPTLPGAQAQYELVAEHAGISQGQFGFGVGGQVLACPWDDTLFAGQPTYSWRWFVVDTDAGGPDAPSKRYVGEGGPWSWVGAAWIAHRSETGETDHRQDAGATASGYFAVNCKTHYMLGDPPPEDFTIQTQLFDPSAPAGNSYALAATIDRWNVWHVDEFDRWQGAYLGHGYSVPALGLILPNGNLEHTEIRGWPTHWSRDFVYLGSERAACWPVYGAVEPVTCGNEQFYPYRVAPAGHTYAGWHANPLVSDGECSRLGHRGWWVLLCVGDDGSYVAWMFAGVFIVNERAGWAQRLDDATYAAQFQADGALVTVVDCGATDTLQVWRVGAGSAED